MVRLSDVIFSFAITGFSYHAVLINQAFVQQLFTMLHMCLCIQQHFSLHEVFDRGETFINGTFCLSVLEHVSARTFRWTTRLQRGGWRESSSCHSASNSAPEGEVKTNAALSTPTSLWVSAFTFGCCDLIDRKPAQEIPLSSLYLSEQWICIPD